MGPGGQAGARVSTIFDRTRDVLKASEWETGSGEERIRISCSDDGCEKREREKIDSNSVKGRVRLVGGDKVEEKRSR